MTDRARDLELALTDVALAASAVVRAGRGRSCHGPLEAACKRAGAVLRRDGTPPRPPALELLRVALQECEAQHVDWPQVVALVNHEEPFA